MEGWRACYRGSKSSALVFDVSYLNLIQVQGKSDVLGSTLNSLTQDKTGKTFDASSAGKEETALVFTASGKVIGEVTYFWVSHSQVEHDKKEDNSTIWIFVHPAFIQQIMAELKLAFKVLDTEFMTASEDSNEPLLKKLKLDPETSDEAKTQVLNPPSLLSECSEINEKSLNMEKSVNMKKNVNLEKMSTRNIPANRAPSYHGLEGTTITDFQGTVNRFRLVGPKSAEILRSVCVPADVESSELVSEKKDLTWWRDYYSSDKNKVNFKSETESFKSGNNANIALTVRDPRLLLPIKKCPAIKSPSSSPTKTSIMTSKPASLEAEAASKTIATDPKVPEPGGVPTITQNLWLESPFFSASIRDAVTLSKCPDAEINKHRSNLLIPGSRLTLGVDESRVPVLILKQDTGYDLLVPAGWGMSFWQGLVFNGCRAGGDKELQQHTIEQGKPPLLHRYPDALAGQQELENIAKSTKAHHFALPPNKRVNFAKLGIASPFQPPWTVLVKDWRTDNSLQPSQLPEAVHVLRDEDVLKRLRVGDVNGLEVLLDYLVAVKLRIEGKGKLGENTIICIPSPQDLEVLEGPMERIQEDSMEKERKETRENHQLTKKRLKRQWKKLKDKEVLLKTQSSALGKPLDQERLNLIASNRNIVKQIREQKNAEFSARNEELWIGDFNTVRNSCKREIFGFITAANMSYTIGGYLGFGFVSLRGLLKWKEISNSKSLVLTRETSSTQYRFSSLTIL